MQGKQVKQLLGGKSYLSERNKTMADKKKTENIEVKEEIIVEEKKLRDEDLEDAAGGTFSVLGGERMWRPGDSKWRSVGYGEGS